MKKISLFFIFFFIVFQISYCNAGRSNIYKSIKAYTSEDYDTYLQSQLIESEITNYYANKEIEMLVFKHIKSDRYKKFIQSVIREYYPPPFWKPEVLNSIIDSAMANNGLWIQEKVYLDFRNRTVTVFDESLRKTEGNYEEVIVNLPPEATFHKDYSYIDMDNNLEYGEIASMSIEFLDSIKDIYFDEHKRKEHELKGIHSRNFEYYWTSLANKWEKCEDVVDKKFYMYFADVYVDAKSIRWIDNYLEGWIKIDFNVDKLKSIAIAKGKQDEVNNVCKIFPNTALYYARFDNNNKQLLIIAGYEVLRDGGTNKYVLNEAELWTYDESPDLVASVLNKIADIYNNRRNY